MFRQARTRLPASEPGPPSRQLPPYAAPQNGLLLSLRGCRLASQRSLALAAAERSAAAHARHGIAEQRSPGQSGPGLERPAVDDNAQHALLAFRRIAVCRVAGLGVRVLANGTAERGILHSTVQPAAMGSDQSGRLACPSFRAADDPDSRVCSAHDRPRWYETPQQPSEDNLELMPSQSPWSPRLHPTRPNPAAPPQQRPCLQEQSSRRERLPAAPQRPCRLGLWPSILLGTLQGFPRPKQAHPPRCKRPFHLRQGQTLASAHRPGTMLIACWPPCGAATQAARASRTSPRTPPKLYIEPSRNGRSRRVLGELPRQARWTTRTHTRRPIPKARSSPSAALPCRLRPRAPHPRAVALRAANPASSTKSPRPSAPPLTSRRPEITSASAKPHRWMQSLRHRPTGATIPQAIAKAPSLPAPHGAHRAPTMTTKRPRPTTSPPVPRPCTRPTPTSPPPPTLAANPTAA